VVFAPVSTRCDDEYHVTRGVTSAWFSVEYC